MPSTWHCVISTARLMGTTRAVEVFPSGWPSGRARWVAAGMVKGRLSLFFVWYLNIENLGRAQAAVPPQPACDRPVAAKRGALAMR